MSLVRVHVLSWLEVYEHVAVLADKIARSGWMPDLLVAIARGGLVPAMLLSDFLGVKSIVTLQLEHWPAAGQVEETVKIKHDLPPVDLSRRRVLVVDDIADTGDTLAFAKRLLESRAPDAEIRTAALHVRKGRAKYIPDYWSVEIETDAWIMYPWNYIEDLTTLVRKAKEKYGEVNLKELLEKLREEANVDLTKIPLVCIKYVLEHLRK